jgi:uncharacterized membrane protein
MLNLLPYFEKIKKLWEELLACVPLIRHRKLSLFRKLKEDYLCVCMSLLIVSFSVRFVSYQKKVGDSSSYNLL